ncbi:NAD(+)--dinitrogen-reductase ADP-D-ribosyltransferase [Niveibacterium sp. 24ML]|uniref:NAD(+)--dinitrogen-reductase ADP-D-ribosyltransferase n=1 Tax=Niveibacterium sp. 24ML TaxID=2985512 RepID=UPI00226E4F6D|nr:NAD(+)--dinitrogen-reductase ADP-D-ribosyltransferase [Niveibacterium sp. 24ML]MCX9154665.1 NAD(+)--dinitrogen-reductase ADP-D-ribosyltransferase [Niveibacterium sp. 24ML]
MNQRVQVGSTASDNTVAVCRDDDIETDNPTLPSWARLPINRCNLPAVVLGSYTFHRYPSPLVLDGVAELHRHFFGLLAACGNFAERARHLHDYMALSFCLDSPEQAGLSPGMRASRGRLNYLKLIRGWHFNSDSVEGAVLKSWVESRFGLLPRHHKAPIRDFSGEPYRIYLEQRSAGLYNTNALEAQLDLLFAWTQAELARRFPGRMHFRLYRGLNHWEAHEFVGQRARERLVVLNNINSFSTSPERAGEFGDVVIVAEVPLTKVLCSAALMPERLQGEDEVLALGGVYAVRRV